MPARRAPAEFSLSFLDVICCGFGAVILLLMITKTVQPQVIEQAMVDAESLVAELTEQLFEIRGETTVLNRDLNVKREQISEYDQQIAILQGTLARTRSEFDALSISQNANAIVQEQLASALQELSKEEMRLLGLRAKKKNDLIGGIPVDSEYIIFIIDTSGSMFSYAWPRMLQEIESTLSIYPEVKGIQVLNDMGDYLFPRYRGEWIPDTPARRSAVLAGLANWSQFSNSSPVEGIETAIKTFHRSDRKISIYVFGDEFRPQIGGSIDDVVQTIDQLNRASVSGERLVRIHAVGFPTPTADSQGTGLLFATLMKELTLRNGGTFVGLNDFRP